MTLTNRMSTPMQCFNGTAKIEKSLQYQAEGSGTWNACTTDVFVMLADVLKVTDQNVTTKKGVS